MVVERGALGLPPGVGTSFDAPLAANGGSKLSAGLCGAGRRW